MPHISPAGERSGNPNTSSGATRAHTPPQSPQSPMTHQEWTPAQYDHPVPVLEIPWGLDKQMYSSEMSKDCDAVSTLEPRSGFQVQVLDNFRHTNACHAELMVKLSKTEAKVLEIGMQVTKLLEVAVTGGSNFRPSRQRTVSSFLGVAGPLYKTGSSSNLSSPNVRTSFMPANQPLTRPTGTSLPMSDIPTTESSSRGTGILKKKLQRTGSSLDTTESSFAEGKHLTFGKRGSTSDRPRLRRNDSRNGTRFFSDGESVDNMEKLARLVSSNCIGLNEGSIRKHVWEFLENRMSSRWAFYYGSYFVPLFLVVSVMIPFLQSAKSLTLTNQSFIWIQSGFEACFLTEVVIRFCVCPNRWEFWTNTYNQIDVLSTLPLFFRLVWILVSPDKDMAPQEVALLPVLRLLKMVRRSRKLHLLVSAFQIAAEALPVLLFALSLMALIFAYLMFCVEDQLLLPTLSVSLWFVFVTMTTVGYGDIVPETAVGSILTVMLMVSSVLYMAMPLGIVGNAFATVWNDRDRLLFIAALRENFSVSGISIELIREMFLLFGGKDQHDEDDEEDESIAEDPELELNDFKRLMHALQIGVPDDRITALFEYLDEDGGGSISCEEFLLKVFPSYAKMQIKKSIYSTVSGNWGLSPSTSPSKHSIHSPSERE